MSVRLIKLFGFNCPVIVENDDEDVLDELSELLSSKNHSDKFVNFFKMVDENTTKAVRVTNDNSMDNEIRVTAIYENMEDALELVDKVGYYNIGTDKEDKIPYMSCHVKDLDTDDNEEHVTVYIN